MLQYIGAEHTVDRSITERQAIRVADHLFSLHETKGCCADVQADRLDPGRDSIGKTTVSTTDLHHGTNVIRNNSNGARNAYRVEFVELLIPDIRLIPIAGNKFSFRAHDRPPDVRFWILNACHDLDSCAGRMTNRNIPDFSDQRTVLQSDAHASDQDTKSRGQDQSNHL